MEELQKLQLHKHHKSTDKYPNVHAKVVTSFRDKKKHDVDRGSTDKVEIDKQAQNGTNVFENDKKQTSSVKKIVGPGMNNNVSSRQKRTGKYKNQQKLQPKVSSEPNVMHKFDNAANGSDESSTIKYKNQGIQTLDTDQLESIYSEGVIR